MSDDRDAHEFEIGARFCCMMEDRIALLEWDAARDEAALWTLENADHIRRHLRLIAVQREEAMRIRRFLEYSGTRAGRPVAAS
jgi:hypothetical protein